MKQAAILFLVLLALLTGAQAETLTLVRPEEGTVIHPGQAVIVAFETDVSGQVQISLEAEGSSVPIHSAFQAAAGYNALYWNGTSEGIPVSAGEYRLVVQTDGSSADIPVNVGEPAPYFLYIHTEDPTAAVDKPLAISYGISESARLTISLVSDADRKTLFSQDVSQASGTFSWNGTFETVPVEPGEYVIAMVLESESGVRSTEEHIQISVNRESSLDDVHHVILEADAQDSPQDSFTIFTPVTGSDYEPREDETGYWVTPMDITNEEAVWAMLTAPVTVLDNGKKNAQKSQITIREAPNEKSAGVGVVTMVSQGVRVLERGEEWTLIECYSSSFHDSAVKAWNMLVRGYVPTKYLKTVYPDQEIGYVVDKLTQRLYVFQDGHLLDILLVSTGHANEKQPYNETRSGEFLLMVPAVGGYVDDGMYVKMAIRFNGGDLIHQVPYTLAKDGSKYFGTFEPRLGTKASHGCIRTQRRLSSKGLSIEWIYSHRSNNQKIIIWEDWQGRQIPKVDPNTTVYYNAKGGNYYHSSEKCYSAKGVTFTPFLYGQLDEEPFSKLKVCTWCNPPMRREDIEEVNALYAPGGDHDPILTKARKKYLESR